MQNVTYIRYIIINRMTYKVSITYFLTRSPLTHTMKTLFTELTLKAAFMKSYYVKNYVVSLRYY